MVVVLTVVGAFGGVFGRADCAGGGPKDHWEPFPNPGNSVPTTNHNERWGAVPQMLYLFVFFPDC